jgi:hypothetical protein
VSNSGRASFDKEDEVTVLAKKETRECSIIHETHTLSRTL